MRPLSFLAFPDAFRASQEKKKKGTAVHRQQHWIHIKLGQIPGAMGKPGFTESYWAGVICSAT